MAIAPQSLISFHPSNLMFIYQPHINSTDRVSWHGGESTQLHYEQQLNSSDVNSDWIAKGVRTLPEGLPTGMSELQRELIDYYNYCQTGVLDD
jgi:hypothetical protein